VFGFSLEEKKEHIAKIAGDIFFAKGFKDASLQDISVKGNISKAGIYYYFKTKEDILSYILFKYTELGIKALKDTLERNKKNRLDEKQSVVELIKTYATYLLKNRKNSLLVLRERHQLGAQARKMLLQQERAIFSLFKNELKNVPSINPKINISLISFKIISMIHWMGYWLKDRGDLSQAEAINQGIAIFFNGILDSKNGERV
jgi:TetR/AcrR family transcriptional regulator, cholesterol catabolism regulator